MIHFYLIQSYHVQIKKIKYKQKLDSMDLLLLL